MQSEDELSKFRTKLLERYVALRKKHGHAISISFNELWYDFLLAHMISGDSIEIVYEKVCANLEQSWLAYLHDRDHR
jgi:hypothetical protein